MRMHNPPHPGEILNGLWLQPMGLSVTQAAGALGVAMSGAGPSLMAYTTEKIDAIGEAMVQAFKKYDISSRYLCLGIDYQGARIVDFA